jgi:hypothetical protein
MNTRAETGAAPAAMHHGKRLVRNYLLDTSLQLRLAAYLLAVAIALCGALGWLLWNAYSETSRVVALGDPELAGPLGAILAREDQVRMMWLAGALVLLLVILLAAAVVVTHRVAGPAFVLGRTCREIAKGSLVPPRAMRSGDLLQDLAEDVSAMVQALRAREERERALVAAAATRLRAHAGDADERARALDELEGLVADKAQRLGS